MTGQLTVAVTLEPADLYIAHYTASLPAAAAAADYHRSLFSFDAEDFHLGEFVTGDPARRAVRIVEKTLLSRCAYITAASPRIAEAYANTYGITAPTVVLNVFPRSHAPIAQHRPVQPIQVHRYTGSPRRSALAADLKPQWRRSASRVRDLIYTCVARL